MTDFNAIVARNRAATERQQAEEAERRYQGGGNYAGVRARAVQREQLEKLNDQADHDDPLDYATALRSQERVVRNDEDHINQVMVQLCGMASLYDDEKEAYVQQAMLRDACYSAQRNMEWTQKRIDEVLDTLKLARDVLNGTIPFDAIPEGGENIPFTMPESLDRYLNSKADYLDKLEDQQHCWKLQLEGAKNAYRQMLGSEWTPSPRSEYGARQGKARQTAGAKRAADLLARFNR